MPFLRLQGTNATYIDEIYARFEKDPGLGRYRVAGVFQEPTQPGRRSKERRGTVLGRTNWPLTPQDDLTSALDGNWAEVEKAVGTKLAVKAQALPKGAEVTVAELHQATRDSARALMSVASGCAAISTPSSTRSGSKRRATAKNSIRVPTASSRATSIARF